jgi:hypothetical protein
MANTPTTPRKIEAPKDNLQNPTAVNTVYETAIAQQI